MHSVQCLWQLKPVAPSMCVMLILRVVRGALQEAGWLFEKPIRNGEHPTMKPIGLCARAIQNSSRSDESVADFFGGSRSTLMAAEQTGRVCYMMEIDPVYCDVIVRRWEEYSGQKRIRLSGSL
ncbi:DNA methyltransferase [Sporomusa sp.]|uniref:DNA methyltransferase n=1 Tax=Sporomusa sp. TaxID=2078658 RepID=UPI0039C8F620